MFEAFAKDVEDSARADARPPDPDDGARAPTALDPDATEASAPARPPGERAPFPPAEGARRMTPDARINGEAHHAEGVGIRIGPRSDVPEQAAIHADPGLPVEIGAEVVIGRRAFVPGARIVEGVLIGRGEVALNGARTGAGPPMGAGAPAPAGREIPPGGLVIGAGGGIARTRDARRRGAGDAARQRARRCRELETVRGWAAAPLTPVPAPFPVLRRAPTGPGGGGADRAGWGRRKTGKGRTGPPAPGFPGGRAVRLQPSASPQGAGDAAVTPAAPMRGAPPEREPPGTLSCAACLRRGTAGTGSGRRETPPPRSAPIRPDPHRRAAPSIRDRTASFPPRSPDRVRRRAVSRSRAARRIEVRSLASDHASAPACGDLLSRLQAFGRIGPPLHRLALGTPSCRGALGRLARPARPCRTGPPPSTSRKPPR